MQAYDKAEGRMLENWTFHADFVKKQVNMV